MRFRRRPCSGSMPPCQDFVMAATRPLAIICSVTVLQNRDSLQRPRDANKIAAPARHQKRNPGLSSLPEKQFHALWRPMQPQSMAHACKVMRWRLVEHGVENKVCMREAYLVEMPKMRHNLGSQRIHAKIKAVLKANPLNALPLRSFSCRKVKVFVSRSSASAFE